VIVTLTVDLVDTGLQSGDTLYSSLGEEVGVVNGWTVPAAA
jgi:hypothetical protein